MGKDIFSQVIKLIKNQKSYNSQQNIADYWSENRQVLSSIINNKYPLYSQTFELIIRWHSDLGCECKKQIVNFINDIQERSLNSTNGYSTYVNIDLNQFKFEYNKREYTLNDVVTSFNTSSRIFYMHDFRGIDLSGIELYNCIIKDCFFANANFSKARLKQVKFLNCIFSGVKFDYSELVSVEYDDKTRFGDISVKNTFFNAIDFSGFSDLKNIKEPSYFFLIKESLKSIFGIKNSQIMSQKKHSVFSMITTENNIEKRNVELISYVDWFQYVTTNIMNIRNLSYFEKIRFLLALIATKYWKSGSVLFIFSIIVNMIYSFIYYNLSDNFSPKLEGITDCIYFSIGTFASGFGGITPISGINKVIVTTEVMIGYTILGAFIFLLSKKISKLF